MWLPVTNRESYTFVEFFMTVKTFIVQAPDDETSDVAGFRCHDTQHEDIHNNDIPYKIHSVLGYKSCTFTVTDSLVEN